MACRKLIVVVAVLGAILAVPNEARAESIHIPLPPPAGFPQPGIAVDWPEFDGGVATSSLALGTDDGSDAIASGSLELTGCRWLWYGRVSFDFTLTDSASHSYPLRTRLGLYNFIGDFGFGGVYETEISGPGQFSVLFDRNEIDAFFRSHSDSGGRTWVGQGSHFTEDDLPGCAAENSTDRTQIGSAATTIDMQPPNSGFSANSVETLLSTIDPLDPAETLRPLATLLSNADLPRFDRLHVARNLSMTKMAVQILGTCIIITSEYEVGATVKQSRGCQRPKEKLKNERRVADKIWRVTIGGPADARASVREDLRRYRSRTIPQQKAGGKPFRPAKWLDAVVADAPERPEIARFRWKKGFVSIFDNGGGGERYADPIVATPREQTFIDGSNMPCVEWRSSILLTAGGGFVYVVAKQPLQATLETTGDPIELSFVTAGRTRQVGFADLSGHPEVDVRSLVFKTPEGDPISCDDDLP